MAMTLTAMDGPFVSKHHNDRPFVSKHHNDNSFVPSSSSSNPHVRTNFGARTYTPPDFPGTPPRLVPPAMNRVHQQPMDPITDERPFDETPSKTVPEVVSKKVRSKPSPENPYRDVHSDVDLINSSSKSIESHRPYHSETDDCSRVENPVDFGHRLPGDTNSGKGKTRSPERSETTVSCAPTEPTSNHDMVPEEVAVSEEAGVQGKPCPLAGALDTRPRGDYEEFGIAEASITDGSLTNKASVSPTLRKMASDEDSIFDFGPDPTELFVATVAPMKPTQLLASKGKKSSATRRGRRARRRIVEQTSMTDDDTSIEHDYGDVPIRPSGLQQRAQKAFSSRSKRATSPTSSPHRDSPGDSSVPRVVSPKMASPKTTGATTEKGGVSFGDHKVYHIERDAEEDNCSWTMDTQLSVTSDYTKSIESEVEDAIKDLFFIGRAKNHKPGRKRKIKDEDETTVNSTIEGASIGEETLDTQEDDEETAADTKSDTRSLESDTMTGDSSVVVPPTAEEKTKKTAGGEADDPLLAVWTAVNGSMETIKVALGLIPESTENSSVEDSVKPPDKSPFPNMDDRKESPPFVKTIKSPTFDSMLEYAQDIIKNSTSLDTSDTKGTPATTSTVDETEASGPIEVEETKLDPTAVFGASSAEEVPPAKVKQQLLEDDPRLTDLALHTCRSMHRIHGMLFDDKSDVNVITLVKFTYVKIGLPLGILFQENGGGCWVAKIYAEGNADNITGSEGVLVGDQLAAINGVSCIEFKVDDICEMIAATDNKNEIELTFLRYNGPLRPLRVFHEEGYEIESDASTLFGAVGLESQNDRDPAETAGAADEGLSAPQPSGLIRESESESSFSKSSTKATSAGWAKSTDKKKALSFRPQSKGKRFKWFGRKKTAKTNC